MVLSNERECHEMELVITLKNSIIKVKEKVSGGINR